MHEKRSKNLLPLREQTLSKKSQEKDDKIKRNLKTDNMNWNIWKSQIHWKMLEWVYKISKLARKTPIRLLQRKIILIKMIERLIGLSIHNLKH